MGIYLHSKAIQTGSSRRIPSPASAFILLRPRAPDSSPTCRKALDPKTEKRYNRTYKYRLYHYE